MTSNQVQYWANQETARHNRVEENIKAGQLDESVRHNKEDEYAKLVRAVGNELGMAYHLTQRGDKALKQAFSTISSIFAGDQSSTTTIPSKNSSQLSKPSTGGIINFPAGTPVGLT